MSLDALLSQSTTDIADIQLKVDYCVFNNQKSLAATELIKTEGKKLFAPERTYVIQDQVVPPNSPESSTRQQELASFARDNETEYFYGVAMAPHLLLSKVKDGNIVVGTDANLMMLGAVGALGIGECVGKLAQAAVYGKVTEPALQTLRVNLKGTLGEGVDIRDAARAVVDSLKTSCKENTVIEFWEAEPKLSLRERMILCGYMQKLGIFSSLFVKDTEPKAGCSVDFDKVVSSYGLAGGNIVKEVAPEAVTEVFIGGAVGGFLEDIKLVAEAFQGKKVAYKVRLNIAPATSEIYNEAADAGYLTTLMEAGALILNQCANPSVQGKIGVGELMISNDLHNEEGYAGVKEGRIYLSSTYNAIKAALNGKVGGEA